LSGLVGTWIANAVTYSRVARSSRLLKEASDRVDFWKKWLEARIQLSPDDDLIAQRKLAVAELDKAFKKFASLDAKQTPKERYEQFIERRRHLKGFKKWLLLYSPLYAKAWVTRIVFFAYLLLLPGFVLANVRLQANIEHRVSQATAKGVNAPNVAEEHERRLFKNMDILLVVLSIGFALIFRTWSYRTETQGFRHTPLN
jgi:hypothetical protein